MQQRHFFESVPSGGDAYLLRWIIHDWNDEMASIILSNCHRAMPTQGKLLLLEGIIPAGNEPSLLKFIDLLMLMIAGGRERTEAEQRSLLRSNGFELTQVISTPSMLSILESVKLQSEVGKHTLKFALQQFLIEQGTVKKRIE